MDMAIRVLNIILAFVVFLSSSGFVVHEHYCQGELRSFAMFVQASECEKNATGMDCLNRKRSYHSRDQGSEHDCCNETSIYHKLDQDQEVTIVPTRLTKNAVMVSGMPVPAKPDFTWPDIQSPRHSTVQPFIVCDNIAVLLQTFLL